MSIAITLAFTIGFFYLLYRGLKGSFGGGKISATGSMICPNCGTQGEPKMITQGSTGIELILWCFFIIPGLIYSIWRLSSKKQGCPSCSQPMINVNTPNGRLLAEKLHS